MLVRNTPCFFMDIENLLGRSRVERKDFLAERRRNGFGIILLSRSIFVSFSGKRETIGFH